MIKIYVPNLSNRGDRYKHIVSEIPKDFFDLKIINPIKHSLGNVSLWHTIQYIIREKVHINNDFFIFCEDDHLFTEIYSLEYLQESIKEAQDLNADILSGGVSWFQTGIQISKNLFWVERFSGLQFTVVFKKFYSKILSADFNETDAADFKISDLSDRKFVMYPFISIQKEFGYSDVTERNNEEGRVERLFDETSERLQLLKNVRNFYLPEFK